MESNLKITSVSKDIVNTIYVARGDNFQFTIEHSDFMEWKFKLQQGVEIEIERKHLNCFDGVHIFE